MVLENENLATRSAEQDTDTGTPAVPLSPFCRDMRSKRYYFLDQMPTEEKHLLDGSNRCWCQKTMQALGPDGNMVHVQTCTSGRSCYRSHFEE